MNPAKLPKYVIYTRVFAPKQVREGDGLRSQETRCREFASYKGYEVVNVFSDDISGGSATRPAMTAMIKMLKKHRAEGWIVIIDDISRFARDVRGHWELRDLLRAAGGKLESPSIEFGEDSDSILVENLLASVSQHQRQKMRSKRRTACAPARWQAIGLRKRRLAIVWSASPGTESCLFAMNLWRLSSPMRWKASLVVDFKP